MDIRPYVSVIIPACNRRDTLRRTLQCLASQDYNSSPIEVIIADTGSTDGTPQVIADFRSRLHLRHLMVPKASLFNAPIARNVAASVASGEILVFIDSDTVVPPHFIREHVSCHEYARHVLVAGLVCHVFAMKMDPGPDGGFIEADTEGMVAPYQASMLEFSGNLGSSRFPWSYCYGANYSMAKEDFIAQNLRVDEEFANRGWGASDTELAYRAYRRGLRMIFSRYAVTYHDLGTASSFDSKERINRVSGGLDYLAAKHACPGSDEYVRFRLQECEEFLGVLLKASKSSSFPILRQAEWLAWMDKFLHLTTPSVSLLLFTAGDAQRVQKILAALGEQTHPHHDFEVLLCDSSACGRVGSLPTSQRLDLLVQTLDVDYCLRYYPVADVSAAADYIGIGVKSCYSDLNQSRRNLSRIGWYFSTLNNCSLYGRLRGRLCRLVADDEVITRDYVACCITAADDCLNVEQSSARRQVHS